MAYDLYMGFLQTPPAVVSVAQRVAVDNSARADIAEIKISGAARQSGNKNIFVARKDSALRVS